MRLRSISDTYFTAIPADIVGCVNDLIPVPIRGNNMEVQHVWEMEYEHVTGIVQSRSNSYMLSRSGSIFVDDNGVMLTHMGNEILVNNTTKLVLPPTLEVWALALLDNNVCVVGGHSHFVYVNYITNTVLSPLLNVNAGQPDPMYKMIGFHNNNVATFNARARRVMLYNDSGELLRVIKLIVKHWTVDSTDQLIVLNKQKGRNQLQIFNSGLDVVCSWCPFRWFGPFLANRRGELHIVEEKKHQIVVIKTS